MIRKQSGIAFHGTTDERVVDRSMLIGSSDRVQPAPGGRVFIDGLGEIPASFHRTERGVVTISFSDPEHALVHTIEWEDHPAGNFPGPVAVMTLSEMEDSVERVVGVRAPLTPPPAGSPTLLRRLCGRNTRLAERYRDRRVFIAGDAAHVHSAAGGPGLNLALQDAANLAWKLAAEVHGWAPERLPETYETERRAIGERVFLQTQAQTALMTPGSDVTALRQLFRELLTRRENVQQVAELMAGSDVRYDMGEERPAAPTGWFAPSLHLTTEEGRPYRLAELLRDARPLFLDLSGGIELADAVEPWSDRVVRVSALSDDAPAAALLIRPDGYVAWAGTDSDALRAALGRWFGPGDEHRPSALPGEHGTA